jgi:hypothetical protein
MNQQQPKVLPIGHVIDIGVGEYFLVEYLVNSFDLLPKDTFFYYKNGLKMAIKKVIRSGVRSYNVDVLLNKDITDSIKQQVANGNPKTKQC